MSVFKRAKHAAQEGPEPIELSQDTLKALTQAAPSPGFARGGFVDKIGANPGSSSGSVLPPFVPAQVVDGNYVGADGVEAVYADAREQAQLRAEENYNLVESPDHYRFPGGAQVIDITKHLGFLEGNIIKYVARAGRKGDRKEDLLKAKKYLEWALEEAS